MNNKLADKRSVEFLTSAINEFYGVNFSIDRLHISQEEKLDNIQKEKELIKKIIPLLDGHTFLEVKHVLKALIKYTKECSSQTHLFLVDKSKI